MLEVLVCPVVPAVTVSVGDARAPEPGLRLRRVLWRAPGPPHSTRPARLRPVARQAAWWRLPGNCVTSAAASSRS